ncbi:unnamed protein product [Dovyalis caffra]|uniref:HMA domain-containing protein n=1 Tax=Dovyalis caffra TaxID=77055 RepID=A0AAV1QT79_9ROSI|nr:unnamed protein product [Dovyalis caffra]
MTEQVTKMVIKFDLECEKCHKKIKKVLCKIPEIQSQTYDQKANTVTITVVSCFPEKIKKKIRCKGGEAIKCIYIEKQPEESPPPETTPPTTPSTEPVTGHPGLMEVHVIMAVVGQHPNVMEAGVVVVVAAEAGVTMCVDVNMFVKMIPAQSCKGKGKAWNS